MIELYNALKFITMLYFIQKILTINLGIAFLKSVSTFLIYLIIGKLLEYIRGQSPSLSF